MRAKVERMVQLILTEEEAIWLKANVQNPLHGQNFDEENEADSKMRKRFWDSLDEQGISVL